MPSSDTTLANQNSPRVSVGVVIGAHGIRGQVRVKTFTTDPLDILSYGALTNKDGTKRYELTIDAESKGGLIASLKGVRDRNAAELLRGTEFYVVKDRLPEADADEEEFLYDDLVGLKALSATGDAIGEITAVYNFGASDVVEMRLASTGKKEMYPFTKAIFPTLDMTARTCIVELPDILETGKREKDDE